MLKKILLTSIIVSMIYILSAGAFAAPQRLSKDYTGNSDEVIRVTNPRNNMSTTKGNIAVSVIGNEGTMITLYTPDSDSEEYYVIHPEAKNIVSKRVGASGLYVTGLSLSSGINQIGIYAELNGRDQFVIRQVNRVSGTIRDSIRSILIRDIRDVMRSMGSN